MDVVHVSLAIGFITNEMFPKPALPQSSFTPFGAAFRNSLAFFKVAREISLNQTPTGGKIGIAGRQRQNAMQMIGQNHDGINAEGMLRPNLNESRTQQLDLVDQQLCGWQGNVRGGPGPRYRSLGFELPGRAPGSGVRPSGKKPRAPGNLPEPWSHFAQRRGSEPERWSSGPGGPGSAAKDWSYFVQGPGNFPGDPGSEPGDSRNWQQRSGKKLQSPGSEGECAGGWPPPGRSADPKAELLARFALPSWLTTDFTCRPRRSFGLSRGKNG
jgi:hypothetical protein